jgi:hypothetical protein
MQTESVGTQQSTKTYQRRRNPTIKTITNLHEELLDDSVHIAGRTGILQADKARKRARRSQRLVVVGGHTR